MLLAWKKCGPCRRGELVAKWQLKVCWHLRSDSKNHETSCETPVTSSTSSMVLRSLWNYNFVVQLICCERSWKMDWCRKMSQNKIPFMPAFLLSRPWMDNCFCRRTKRMLSTWITSEKRSTKYLKNHQDNHLLFMKYPMIYWKKNKYNLNIYKYFLLSFLYQ